MRYAKTCYGIETREKATTPTIVNPTREALQEQYGAHSICWCMTTRPHYPNAALSPYATTGSAIHACLRFGKVDRLA